MTIRIKKGVEGVQPGQTHYFGGFAFNGSSAPATLYGNEKEWFSVAHTGTGVWTVTLDLPMSSFIAIALTLNLPTGETDLVNVRVGDKDASAKTFDIEALVAANTAAGHPAAADIAAATDTAVYFHVVVSDSDMVGSA